MIQEGESSTNPINLNSPVQSSQSSVQRIKTKLPRLVGKKFNGKIQEWQSFWDSFRSSIHENEGMSKVDKFIYLNSLLEDQAGAAVQGFALTEANYDATIESCKIVMGKKILFEEPA